MAKNKIKNVVYERNNSPQRIKEIIRYAQTKIGSVHFIKKDGTLRKMTYRVKVFKPSIAPKVKGKKDWKERKTFQEKHNIMTVLDTNKVIRKRNKIVGRGAWRSIPLNRVVRVIVNNIEYLIVPNLRLATSNT